jgi:cell wall-associated NlpC family hydrolase
LPVGHVNHLEQTSALRGRPWALFAVLVLVCVCLFAPSARASKVTAGTWNLPEQHIVVKAGVMSDLAAGFQGELPLTGAQMQSAIAALATTEGTPPIAFSVSAPMTVVRFDALLVDQLGLGDVANIVQSQAGAAGLDPPSYFGTEVVARYLELRYMQPTQYEAFELYPTDLITRAEAAHSFSVILGFSGWQVEQAREVLSTFALPHYSSAQRQVLSLAVSKIGMPYVWGGTTDDTSDGLAHGGYDCSGFAWRVYKVSGFSWGTQILGRTAAEQAGEIPKSQRLHLAEVQGGDLLFFGSAHFDSKATESNVIHEGIALSNQWAIHSSNQGVYVLPLASGWLAESFTWARRVL